jgi:hypothetical protein
MGYTRIQGALANLSHKVARGTVSNVLKRNGIEPASSMNCALATLQGVGEGSSGEQPVRRIQRAVRTLIVSWSFSADRVTSRARPAVAAQALLPHNLDLEQGGSCH